MGTQEEITEEIELKLLLVERDLDQQAKSEVEKLYLKIKSMKAGRGAKD